MRVKICGITNYEDARMCADYGADVLGFIFAKSSPRYIEPKTAQKIISKLPCFVQTVGVFVDEDAETVKQIAALSGVDILQFHGSESMKYCTQFSDLYKTIKVFFTDDVPSLEKIKNYQVDAFMFDLSAKQKAASPESVNNFSGLTDICSKYDCILSGGLCAENILEALKIKPYAVDLARGTEILPGKKDALKVKKIMEMIRKYE